MDGVLVDSERVWHNYEPQLLDTSFGQEIHKKIGSVTGISLKGIYAKAISHGHNKSFEDFQKVFDEIAPTVYEKSPLAENVDKLGDFLIKNDFKLAIVSSSPSSWIKSVTHRLPFKDDLDIVLSLNERPDLKGKPAPDGYLETIRELGSTPAQTLIVEDSNPGIASAKAAGAYTIGFSGNLIPEYKQDGADVYANSILLVIDIVKNWLTTHK